MKPLVSILIPAYNAEEWIGDTLQSAVAQTWPRTEIIVVNDGSTDRTANVVRRFESKAVKVVSTENRGLSAAVNYAYRLSQGDYIQELDADDILAPDKIEQQLKALQPGDTKRTLLSCPWGYFYYRTRRAQFHRTSLWNDLTPVDWLLRKMSESLHMQNATWLVSRELAEAAGPWDENLHYDQDGEYFCRVLMAAEKTRFVASARIFYRVSGSNRISYIGGSDKKRASLLRSMKLHIQYLCSLEESERVRKACLRYLQTRSGKFYPHRPDMFAELQALAAELGGHVELPTLRWKYRWMKPLFGLKAARWAQRTMPETKSWFKRHWDKTMFRLESRQAALRFHGVLVDRTSAQDAGRRA
jgi:glycosyltransferase involved in cell wall biosynthesis